MPNSTPSNKAQNLAHDCWYYEEKGSIDVIVWITGYDGRRKVTHVEIPHRKLLATLRRAGKVK